MAPSERLRDSAALTQSQGSRLPLTSGDLAKDLQMLSLHQPSSMLQLWCKQLLSPVCSMCSQVACCLTRTVNVYNEGSNFSFSLGQFKQISFQCCHIVTNPDQSFCVLPSQLREICIGFIIF